MKWFVIIALLFAVGVLAFVGLPWKKAEAPGIEAAAEMLTFSVDPYTRECVGVGPQQCLVVNGEFFYDDIAGFTFEEGTAYELVVERSERENVPADASRYEYRLVEVISATPASESEVQAETPLLRVSPANTEWSYDGGVLRFDDKRYYMDFGCNSMSGSFTVDRTTLTFGPTVSTKMACDPETMAKEADFAATIVQMTSFAEVDLGEGGRIGAELSGTGEGMYLERL